MVFLTAGGGHPSTKVLGDLDGDSDLDVVVANGRHWPQQNFILFNQGRARFNLIRPLGQDLETSYATELADLDNDGDLDLYHVNGWIQNEREGDPVEFNDQPARLFENLGDGSFEEVAQEVGAGNKGQGRGVILFDFDNDGDLDIFITNNHEYVVDGTTSIRNPGAPALLRNDTLNGNHWLKVTLEGSPPLHRDGIGSRVYVTTGSVTQMRELHASTNYVTQEPGRIAHFGVGATTIIDEVRTEWVNGEINILNNVQSDQHISISSR